MKGLIGIDYIEVWKVKKPVKW